MIASLGVVTFLALGGCNDGQAKARRAAVEKAEAQVRRLADELDAKTTETGVYIRVEEGEIQEKDPWGTPIDVTYAQGGMAETVTVRSAGPDTEFHTDDDLVAQGTAANFKGIGEGIKKNAEETAANTAKGLVKGTVEGVKDSIKDALPFGKKKEDESKASDKPADEDPSPEEKPEGEQN